MRADFYHVTRDPVPLVAARLADRAVAAGARLRIVARTLEDREAIDAALWSAIPESFLPHPPAGGRDDGEPILISDEAGTPGDVSALILADGEWREAALCYDRVLFLFDGDAIVGARSAWRALGDREGCERRYWGQDGAGRWREGP